MAQVLWRELNPAIAGNGNRVAAVQAPPEREGRSGETAFDDAWRFRCAQRCAYHVNGWQIDAVVLANSALHAPPVSTTESAAIRPRSVHTPDTLPPLISRPRAAQFWSTLAPDFCAPRAMAGAALEGSARPSVADHRPPTQRAFDVGTRA